MTGRGSPYHAHVYYEPAERGAADTLRRFFDADPTILFVGPLADAPVGPHPVAQFEVHFLEDAVPEVRRAIEESGLRGLVHPLTHDDLADHTTLAQWIGEPLELDTTVLDPPGHNQGMARFGRSDR